MEYRVVIPDEVFAALEWEQEDMPAICIVNQALANFEPKIVFGWRLSIIVHCEQLANNGMPFEDELPVLDQFGDEMDEHLKEDGNALFFARITWNGSRQFLYRIYDPEVANDYLNGLIESKSYIREFEFRMEKDDDWEIDRHLLSHWETAADS